MFTIEEKASITAYYELVYDKITKEHIGFFQGYDKPVFLISNEYPGIWLEHVYDAIFFAAMDNRYLDIAKNTLKLFLKNQKPNGQMPCFIINKKRAPNWKEVGYSQIQECVPFARLSYMYYQMSKDKVFLEEAYEGCKRWVEWHIAYRIAKGETLVQMFGTFDTGHDNSGRWEGVKYKGVCKNEDATCYPHEDNVLPIIAPDVNAVYYGNLVALSEMAFALNKNTDAQIWKRKAEDVKRELLHVCYDEADDFFYDVDKNGNKRKFLSISITNVFSAHLMETDMAERIYEKHLHNENEFWTPFPFPSMAVSDSAFHKNREGNSWGYYSQALTILRCTLWMDFYGKSKDFDTILEKWVRQWTFETKIKFGQELDPITGESSACSEWYSSCRLVYLYAVERLCRMELQDILH